MNFRVWLESERIKIYRGESVYNRGGHFWTTDREWARQFTQSGRDSEVKVATIDPAQILRMNPLPRATSEEDFDRAIGTAQEMGFAAVWFDEGPREPDSIYIL